MPVPVKWTSHRLSQNGFTLLEMLVVIAIIALLISILIPALEKAQEQSMRTHCAANLKNLTIAWTLYAGDNKGKLCSGDTQSSSQANSWVNDGPMIPGNDTGGTPQAIKQGALWEYTGQLESYRCKSDTSELIRSYCISRAMNGATCTCKEDHVNPFRMMSEIVRISEKIVFVDAASREKWIEGSFAPFQHTEPNEPTWYVRPSRTITARHAKGFNASFADGHCKWIGYKDKRSVDLAYWRISPELASGNNEDLILIAEAVKSRRWGQ
jgi:prepilin-type N-terminal cleavage/methylation domain-containing protein/prepilin-type processing-associated H-X9-DG protein